MKSDILNFNRIGRIKFLAYSNIAYVSLAIVYYFIIGFDGDFSVIDLYSQKPFIFTLFVLISTIPLKFLAQRYKDAGISGKWALVGLIPHVNVILYLVLGCFRGENHPNEYGDIPKKSDIFLQLIAFIPIVAVIFTLIWFYFINT